MSENRWKRPEETQSDTEEAAAQKKILMLLNKLTPEKWDKLMPQFLAVKVEKSPPNPTPCPHRALTHHPEPPL